MAYYGAVDTLDYGVEKKQKKDGEFDVAMEASNTNSPFAWVQGRAPRNPMAEGGGGGAARSYSPVPLSSPVGVDKAAMKSSGGLEKSATPRLDRIDALTSDRLAAERGEPAAGSPSRSFSSMSEPTGGVQRGVLVTSPNAPATKSFAVDELGVAFSKPTAADAYKGAVQRQGVANENKIGPQSMNDFDEEKKKRVGEFLDGYAPSRGAAMSLGLG